MTQQNKKFYEYLADVLENAKSVYSLKEIADKIGLPSPNMLSMFKRENHKTPLNYIPALADILNVDRADMFRRALTQYYSDKDIAVMTEILSELPEDEALVLRRYRAAKAQGKTFNVNDIELSPEEIVLVENLRSLKQAGVTVNKN